MRNQPSNSKESAIAAFPWASASDWWTPAMTSCSAESEKLRQNCVQLSAEWQTFVGRRIREDFHLLQDLASAKGPDAIWNAYSKFWQKAVEDYGAAYGEMAKRAAGFINSGAVMTQGTGDGAASSAPQRSKAA